LFAPRIYGVVLRALSVRGEPRIQRNPNEEVATAKSYETINQSTNFGLQDDAFSQKLILV